MIHLFLVTISFTFSFSLNPFHPVKEKMESAGIVPDVIDVAPSLLMEIVYNDGRDCYLGCEIKPSNVKDPPRRVAWKRKPYSYYTMCLLDPDVSSRKKPTNRQWLHWLIVNMPGKSFPVDDGIMPGETLAEYVGSAPTKNSGLHRYVFLAFIQSIRVMDVDDEPRLNSSTTEGRSNFSIRQFAKKYNLSEPVAGNFYVAKWDENTPILNGKKL